MTAEELYAGLVALCQQYGFTTEETYEHLHSAVDSIRKDPDEDEDEDVDAPRRTDNLTAVQLTVFQALSAVRWRTPGEVARMLGLRLPFCLAALTELEEMELAVGDVRGWRATPLETKEEGK